MTNNYKRGVDFTNHAADFAAVYMASLGASDQWISEETGLSKSQVGYRARLAGIRRADARNGKTMLARKMLKAAILNDRELPKFRKNCEQEAGETRKLIAKAQRDAKRRLKRRRDVKKRREEQE